MGGMAPTPGVIRRLAAALAAIFLLVHLAALPRTLEDIDSINFALGVEKFDVSSHRPHPPGYPVFMVMAKASTSAIGAVAPGWDRDRRAAVGLAIWGVIAGALAAFVFVDFWIAVGLSPLLAWLASLVAVCSPLFWFTASRPLTDTPGLVAGVLVQTWLIQGWRSWRGQPDRLPAIWWWGAVAAGFFIGMRSQTMWLTGPLLLWVIGELLIQRRMRLAAMSVGAAAAGALVWAVPLLVASGGLSGYLGALGSQGAEDFYAELVVARPGWRLFRAALDRTFVQPWEVAGLGNVVLGLAVIGLVRLALRARGVLATLILGFWPYLVFHVLFHETVTIRYALPGIVPVAGLAIIGLAVLGNRMTVAGAVAMVVASLVVAQPRLMAYANDGSPVFVAFQQMQRELPGASEPPLVRMHHQVWWGVRRLAEWYKPVWDIKLPPHPGQREWLDIVDRIREQPTRAVWFLSDLTRNDVRLIDPRGRALGGQFAIDPEIRRLVGGYRLDGLAWWKIQRPMWMLGRGWSLTPEIAGMTDVDNREPHLVAAEGWIRQPMSEETRGQSESDPRMFMIGGRYLSGNGPAIIRVEIDGEVVHEFTITGTPVEFLETFPIGRGSARPDPPGVYAPLRVSVRAASGSGPSPVVGLEQFDATSGQPMLAFAERWNEQEEDPKTGRLWRWSSDKSTLRVINLPVQGELRLLLSGISPLDDYDRAPNVVVRAGDRELARFSPSADFDENIRVPLDALTSSKGLITIETDLTYVPAERNGGEDRRRLGLRLTRVELQKIN